MPVHDLGYRSWAGKRMPRLLRPWIVAKSGISLVWRRRWLRLVILLAWLPMFVAAFGIFLFEFSATNMELRQAVSQLMMSPLIGQPELARQVMMDPNAARNQVWATLILTFFRYPQAVAMVVLVGLIAPMMISYDLRTKAYLMYFSRPLTPVEYIVGKSAVIWFYLILIVTLPALMLYVCAVFLSPDFSVIGQTWDIPLRILAATVVLVVPTTALALCYSAFTSESRYATFTWFATWAMGSVAYRILTFSGQPRQFTRPPRGRRGDWDRQMNANPEWDQWDAQIDYDKWRLLSPYDTLGKVESWIFGLDATSGSVAPAMILLVVITIGCLWVIRQRIVARLSV